MSLVNWMFKAYFQSRLRQIQHSINHPFETQRALLKQLIASAATTAWRRRYDYKSIDGPRTFSDRVPTTDYETLKPLIDRMMCGEPDVLWPGTTCRFAKSAGTSSDKSKYIPLTRSSLIDCHLKGVADTLALWFDANPRSKFFTGKAMLMGVTCRGFLETDRQLSAMCPP